jgi:hypothetical protein
MGTLRWKTSPFGRARVVDFSFWEKFSTTLEGIENSRPKTDKIPENSSQNPLLLL